MAMNRGKCRRRGVRPQRWESLDDAALLGLRLSDLHLRLDHIREVWAVRKPASECHVTSLEAYDAAGRLIIQFFGKRNEGAFERDDWRGLVETLPRGPRSTAA